MGNLANIIIFLFIYHARGGLLFRKSNFVLVGLIDYMKF